MILQRENITTLICLLITYCYEEANRELQTPMRTLQSVWAFDCITHRDILKMIPCIPKDSYLK